MKAINASKSLVIASDLREASGFFSRLKGLIGMAKLEDGEGLWMARCRAIHTFGMRFPIDVVFLNGENIVKKVVNGLRPFRPMVCCLSAKSVIELPEGAIKNMQIQLGDRIEIVRTSE